MPTQSIDNHSLDCFRDCPTSYKWRIVRGLVRPTLRKTAAEFGSGIHKGLETHYRAIRDGEPRQQAIDSALLAFATYFAPFETLEDDKRTTLKGTEILDKYFERYPFERFRVLGVEVGGAFELTPNWTYTTRMDLLSETESPRGIYVTDHKTTSDIDRFVVKPNNQLTGYIYNVSEMFENVLGGIVNLIGVYKTNKQKDKATGTLKDRDIFRRVPTARTPNELRQWKQEVLYLLHQIEECVEHDIWPPRTAHCAAFRGSCMFKDLCLSESDVQEKLIQGGLYTVQPWIPYINEETMDVW